MRKKASALGSLLALSRKLKDARRKSTDASFHIFVNESSLFLHVITAQPASGW